MLGRFQPRHSMVLLVLAVPLLASCGADTPNPVSASATATPTVSASRDASGRSVAYVTKSFSIPLTVNNPTWQTAPPDPEEANFVTWVSDDDTHAIRFLAPVNHYIPGESKAGPVPKDYVAFLNGLKSKGAELSDVTKATIGGQSATVMNARIQGTGLDGIFGCPTEGMTADDCYGLQPDYPIRVAILDTPGGRPLLIWSRQNAGDSDADRAADSAQFDTLLSTLKFG